jgi:uncharacterized protein YkvS
MGDPLAGYFLNENESSMKTNYSIGDIVRFKDGPCKNPEVEILRNKICTIKSIGDISVQFHELGGSNYTFSCFTPFDGFRIGDEVWTAKRGKLRIISTVNWSAKNDTRKRPFVCIPAGDGKTIIDGCWYPKLSNLIPTESRYKEVINPKIPYDVFWAAAPCANSSLGKLYNQLAENNTKLAEIMTEVKAKKEAIERVEVATYPKFKVGDVVCFRNGKHIVAGFTFGAMDDVNRYRLGNHITGVPESDLRLWKDAVFTHIVGSKTNTPLAKNMGEMEVKKVSGLTPSAYRSCKYLGKNFAGVDTFHCTTNDNCVVILFGERGDDI